MQCDYHVHTSYSDDSHYPMEDVVKDAIQMGMEELCFTDHVDYGMKLDWADKQRLAGSVANVNYPEYFDEIEKLQNTYQGKIVIKKGLEFGIQVHTIPQFKILFDSYPMDFVLLSIHQVNDKNFWQGKFQQGKTIEACYDLYYQELYDVIQQYDKYSVLAHMDLMRRYLDDRTDYFHHNQAIITSILQHIIQHGKGIEVNTSSHRYGIDGLTPSIEILKLYHELGGTIVTIGSDTHRKEHLGAYLEETKSILKNIGFRYICTFDQMRPIYHTI